MNMPYTFKAAGRASPRSPALLKNPLHYIVQPRSAVQRTLYLSILPLTLAHRTNTTLDVVTHQMHNK